MEFISLTSNPCFIFIVQDTCLCNEYTDDFGANPFSFFVKDINVIIASHHIQMMFLGATHSMTAYLFFATKAM
jgi:hypothetical protein